jgi:hypothetical protein
MENINLLRCIFAVIVIKYGENIADWELFENKLDKLVIA